SRSSEIDAGSWAFARSAKRSAASAVGITDAPMSIVRLAAAALTLIPLHIIYFPLTIGFTRKQSGSAAIKARHGLAMWLAL
ncbi:hypothetical protein DF186_22880, partial [Enterococcus hirae]